MAYIFSIIQQSLYHLWRFMERGIIDGAIFEEDEIDPTEIYRDKVLFFFLYRITSNLQYFIWNMKLQKFCCEEEEKGKKREIHVFYTLFH